MKIDMGLEAAGFDFLNNKEITPEVKPDVYDKIVADGKLAGAVGAGTDPSYQLIEGVRASTAELDKNFANRFQRAEAKTPPAPAPADSPLEKRMSDDELLQKNVRGWIRRQLARGETIASLAKFAETRDPHVADLILAYGNAEGLA